MSFAQIIGISLFLILLVSIGFFIWWIIKKFFSNKEKQSSASSSASASESPSSKMVTTPSSLLNTIAWSTTLFPQTIKNLSSTKTIAPIGGAIINVHDYGAIGDGITDDTDALQNAYTFLSSLEDGGILYFPHGTYLCSTSTFYIFNVMDKSNLTFQGDGVLSVIKVKSGEASSKGVLNFVRCSNITIQNLKLDANAFTSFTKQGTHIIRFEDIDGCFINNLSCINGAWYGLGFQPGTFTRITIDNVYIENTGADGIDFKNRKNNNRSINISNVSIRNHGILASGKPGLDMRGPIALSNVSISSPDSKSSGYQPVGIRIRESSSINGLGGKCTVSNIQIKDVYVGVSVEPGDTESVFSNIITNNCNVGFLVYGNNAKFSNCSVLVDSGYTGDGYFLNNPINSSFVNCYYMNNNTPTSSESSTAWRLDEGSGCFLLNCDIVNGKYGFRRVAGTGGHTLQNCRVTGTLIPFTPASGSDLLLNCSLSATNGNSVGQTGNDFKIDVFDSAGNIRLKSKNSLIVDSPKLVYSDPKIMSSSVGSLSGNYLAITINNNNYKIPLYNAV